MMKAEECLNKGLGRILNDLDSLNTKDIYALLWAMLSKESPDITMDIILDTIEEKNITIAYIMSKISEAIMGAGWLVKADPKVQKETESQTGT